MWNEQRLRKAVSTGFSSSLGIRLNKLSKNRVAGNMDVAVGHLSDTGYLHGGVMMTFADALAACGARLNLPPGGTTATMESKTNFLAPCGLGRLSGASIPLHVGARTSVWQTSLYDGAGKRVAVVIQTQIVLYGKNIRGYRR
jgi:uncharacterized protein (TIGR00369 family)